MSLFGVDLVWANPGAGCDDAVAVGMRLVNEGVLRATEAAIRRQKRETVAYWDAMTCLVADDGFVPRRLRDRRECGLARQLVTSIGDGGLQRQHLAPVADLGELESLATVRSRPAYEFGPTALPDGPAVPRPGRDRVELGIDGRWRLRPAGPCRLLEVDMGDLGGDVNRIDWHWGGLLAVLIQLRADIEIFLETGFLRLHRCEHAACRAFFQVARMSGRPQRFCCSSCRAAAARRQRDATSDRTADPGDPPSPGGRIPA